MHHSHVSGCLGEFLDLDETQVRYHPHDVVGPLMALRLRLADTPILDALDLAPMLESEFGRGESGAHGW